VSYTKTPDGKCACWDCGNGGKPQDGVDSINVCSGCGEEISGEILTCEGKKWHRQCFLCGLCQKPILKESDANVSYTKTPDGKCACWDCSAPGKPNFEEGGVNVCSGCGKKINGEWLTCENKMWHRHCFACELCQRPIFKEGDMNLRYSKDSEGKVACSDCTGSQPCVNVCNGCGEKIEGEMLHCDSKVWHRQCFTCDLCQKPLFKEGDTNLSFVRTPDGKSACSDCAPNQQNGGAQNECRDNKPHEGKAKERGTVKITFSHSAFIRSNTGSIHDVWNIAEKRLGEGSFGSVHACSNKFTGVTRAVKSMPKSLMNQKQHDAFEREIAIMKIMDHPNIIKLFESFEDNRNIYLIFELCNGGELFDRIMEAGQFTEVQAATVMQHMFRAIFYMHENHICHRDLKPENFLFTTKEPLEKTALKVIDFGLACKFEGSQVLTTKAGTPYYVAPQVLAGKYDQSADLWSLGVIMYVVLCGYPPFYGETDADVLAKVRLGNFSFNAADWKSVSEDAKNLIRMLLKMNPRDRYTAEQALNHVWVRNKAPKAANVNLQSSLVDNLRGFRSQNKLKKAALHVIASQLGESQIKALRDTFMALDENGDGLLTVNEMKEGLNKCGLKEIPPDLQQIMEEVDSDGSGVIDYTEFLAATLDKKVYMAEDVCWQAFRIFDRNGDGKICNKEIAAVLNDDDVKNAAAKDLADIMKDIDTNGDGEIDFQEFMQMMRGSGPTN